MYIQYYDNISITFVKQAESPEIDHLYNCSIVTLLTFIIHQIVLLCY